MIRFFFKENPDLLNDYEYTKRFKELVWLSKEGFFKWNKIMISFDFSARYQTAFGFTPGHISNALIEAGFDRAIKQHHDTNFKASVYVFDSNTHDVSAAAGYGFFNPDHNEKLGEISLPAIMLQKNMVIIIVG